MAAGALKHRVVEVRNALVLDREVDERVVTKSQTGAAWNNVVHRASALASVRDELLLKWDRHLTQDVIKDHGVVQDRETMLEFAVSTQQVGGAAGQLGRIGFHFLSKRGVN